MLLNFKRVVLPVMLAMLCLAAPARAAFHQWVFAEAFTNADGTVQFIRMHCPAGATAETLIQSFTITCTSTTGTTHTFTFPSGLAANTSDKDILIATPGFAFVPGAVTPDYTLASTGFLFPGGGTLHYTGSTETWVYGAMPTDGLTSLYKSGAHPTPPSPTNTPINFHGDHGFVTIPPGTCCVGTTCSVTISGMCATLGGTWTQGGSCGANPCAPATGACCAASGSCSVATAAACMAGGGTPMASGTTCPPNPCPQPQGVCCAGCTCRLDLAANCSGPNTIFVGGPACNAGNDLVPCCRADYNHTGGKNVGDIFAYLSDWFGQSLRADFVGNGTSTPMVNSIFAFLSAWFAGGC